VGFTVLVVLLVAPLATDQYDDLAGQWPDIRTDIEDQIDEWAAQTREPDSWFPVELPTSEELEDQFLGGNASDLDGNGVVTDEERQQAFADQLDTARELLLRIFTSGSSSSSARSSPSTCWWTCPTSAVVFRGLVPERAAGDAMVLSRRLSTAIGGYFRGQLAVAIVVRRHGLDRHVADRPAVLAHRRHDRRHLQHDPARRTVDRRRSRASSSPSPPVAGVGKAVAVAVVMAIVQQIDNHFISPMVMQRAVKLHPAVVMLAAARRREPGRVSLGLAPRRARHRRR
jgi:hypothetical protein